jgi:hypothetical protein
MFIIIGLYLFVTSRGFRLAHTSRGIGAGSWAAVKGNGMPLPSRLGSPRLGAELPSPRRAQKNR